MKLSGMQLGLIVALALWLGLGLGYLVWGIGAAAADAERTYPVEIEGGRTIFVAEGEAYLRRSKRWQCWEFRDAGQVPVGDPFDADVGGEIVRSGRPGCAEYLAKFGVKLEASSK